MIDDLLRDIIIQNLGPLKNAPKNWKRRNCMMCHTQGESVDRRGRFGILFGTDGSIAMNCFNCAFDCKFVPGRTLSRKFKSFLREIGVTQYDIKKIDFELFKVQNRMKESPDVKLKGIVTKKWVPMDLPPNTLSLAKWKDMGCNDVNFQRVYDYAKSRKFFEYDNLYWTPDTDKMFHKRLLLPFFYKNKIVGYTGRYFGDTPSKEIPKYINRMPPDYIYNLDIQQDWDRKYVILDEGVYDAYLTDGISACGNTLNDDQIQIINSLGKIIIVCPDRDKAGDHLVTIALKQGWHVSFPNWDKTIKDAARATEVYGRILMLHSIIRGAEQNPTTIELKWKLSEKDRIKE